MEVVRLKRFERALKVQQTVAVHDLGKDREIIDVEGAAGKIDRTGRSTEQKFAILGLNRRSELLHNIHAASRGVEDGTFGTCTHCEETIGRNRLVAVLWAPFCIGCQEVVDRGNTSVVEPAYRLDVNAAYSAAARNVADGGAHMSNHRSAVEKSPSDPVPREGQMALGRKRMTHDHGSEYQVRIVHEDQTEELNGWMNSPEKVAQAIAGLRASPVTAYWLQIRNIVCLNCLDNKLTMVEFPLTTTVAENARFPRQTERRPFGSASSRTSSAGE